MRFPILVLLVISQFACGSVKSPKQAINEPPVNILFIIADDMSKDAGIYGDKVISTPAIDQLAKEGVVFDNAFCAAPSCTPSRASILTGRYPHQLREGGNLWGSLPLEYPNYVSLLKEKGYKAGLMGKGWGPGNHQVEGYTDNPAGASYKSFDQFMSELPAGNPFCFWLGSFDPHRTYNSELTQKTAINESAIKIPSWLPDNAEVRGDLMDYYAEVKRFDETVGKAISVLKEKGLYESTIIIVTSDNGRPFPRAKANLYDAGTNIPLVIRWGNKLKKGQRYQELITLMDIAPTLLDAANIEIPEGVTGKSLLPLLLDGKKDKRFEQVFLERERHAKVRADNLGYPSRAIRTAEYLYINNLRPDRWPAGDPDHTRIYGDIDNGPAKQVVIEKINKPDYKKTAQLILGKRPAEELYDLKKDPDQLNNVAEDPAYADIKNRLSEKMLTWRKQTGDPVLGEGKDIFDSYPYYGPELKN